MWERISERLREPWAKRGPALVFLAALSTGLASCDAYNKGFNQAFDKKMHDSCVTSAAGQGAPADAAERYCSCVVDQFKGLTVSEKQSLTVSSDKVTQAAAHCKAQAQPPAPNS